MLSKFKIILTALVIIFTFLNLFTPFHASFPRYLIFMLGEVQDYTYDLNITNETTILFYNIFVSPDSDIESSFDIINEQLEVRANSKHPNLPLYYLTFGKDIGDLDCDNCKHLVHNNIGDEMWTLAVLHQFCSKNPSNNVAYFHNKGSYHPRAENHLLRKMHNKAVFSEECLLLKNPDKKISSCDCNVCSARFSPLPHYHTSGNMWVAQCSYINKLAPPTAFTQMMYGAVSSAPDKIAPDKKKLGGPFIGYSRWAMEHWVHSHPDVCPCDVYPGPFVWNYGNIPSDSNWTIDLAQAPRFPSFDDYLTNFDSMTNAVRNIINSSSGAWYFLGGRLHEWESLYHTAPGNESWVWSYYQKDPKFGKIA